MYFWDQYALGKQLAKGELSEWERAKYYIAFAILHAASGFMGYIPFSSYRPQGIDSLLKLLYTIMSIVIVFRGIKSVFKVNEKIDNYHFIERITCLSFPLTIKFFVVLIGIIIIMSLALSPFKHTWVNWEIYFRILMYIVSILWVYIFYVFLRKSFEKFADFVSSKSGKNKI